MTPFFTPPLRGGSVFMSFGGYYIVSYSTLKLVNLALQGHYNYYGVNGNMKALIGFMWYVRRRVLWMLRRRSQVRKIRVAKFVELWDAFVKAPEVKVSIWGAVSTQTWGAVCGKSARTVLRGGGTQHAG